MDEVKAVDIVITGVVQGVGFRWSALMEAERLGIAGWVSNEYDGSVHAHLEGSDEAVAAMVQWCRKGPRSAVVEHVQVRGGDVTGRRSFDVR